MSIYEMINLTHSSKIFPNKYPVSPYRNTPVPTFQPHLSLYLNPDSQTTIVFNFGKSKRLLAYTYLNNSTPDTRWTDLDHWLKEQASTGLTVTVILANPLCRLWLLPAGDNYLPESARTSLAWLLFRQQFTHDNPQDYHLWLGPYHHRQPQLAIATPQDTLQRLNTLCHNHQARLLSVQPLFTAIWDTQHKNPAPWHLLTDSQRCLLIQHKDGHIRQLHLRPDSQRNALIQQHQAEGIHEWPLTPPDATLGRLLDPIPLEDRAAYQPCLWGIR